VSEGHRCGARCLQTEADRGRNGGGGLVHGARGRRERGTRWLGRDAWRRGLVRAASRGAVLVEVTAGWVA
jgi:hypothetical protein